MAAVLQARTDGREIAVSTSGSTTLPRRVVRTTDSWWISFPAYTALTGVGAQARLWLPGPLTGTMNLFAAVHAHVVGAMRVGDHREATHALLTPAGLARALDELPHGMRVTVAGAALSPALADRAEGAGVHVAHYYGAAELSFVAGGRDAGSLVPFEGVEVDLRAGTVWVRSAYLCSRVEGEPYLHRIDDEGWATVGDLAAVNGGRLDLLGRPDAISTGGATVVLAEVERTLDGRVTCFGVPQEPLGEVLGAAVERSADLDAIKAVARARLAPTHRPRIWLVVDPLPLTPAGKPDRRALSQRARRAG